jgi:hypothetical protein
MKYLWITTSARVLRLLATNHIFTEVSPDVFTNNRLSSVLDTGKSVEELMTRLALCWAASSNKLTIVSPESKHIGTLGMTSIMEHVYVKTAHSGTPTQALTHSCSLDEGFKSSSYLTETLLDPELGHAHATNKTAFNKAHNVDEDYWSWLERPDNRLRLTRFGAAMNGLGNMAPKDAILEGSRLLRGVADHHHLTRNIVSKGTHGISSQRTRWLSMSEVAWARSR